MSGPIVRRYGFANFDRIFGTREVPHGRDVESAKPADPVSPMKGEKPADLIPDLARGDQPLDAESASEANTMAPATEFGQSGG
jgi:hypothetical protein